ncbi:MAG TPA: HAD family hydrolase [Clostridiales bacterium]|nr:HAD family hydrolase [Clostridiales bacterium]
MEFQRLCNQSKGIRFLLQREIEIISLQNTINHFKSNINVCNISDYLFEYWQKLLIFDDSTEFFKLCPVPIIIVSNIDTDDLMHAISYNNLNPYGIVTSEEAKSYKPDKKIFDYTLKKYNLNENDVIHIGDSVSSDIIGAENAGINAIWINRKNKTIPDIVNKQIIKLTDILND